jgi:type IV pilus secretin PilQ/predicted competence protein
MKVNLGEFTGLESGEEASLFGDESSIHRRRSRIGRYMRKAIEKYCRGWVLTFLIISLSILSLAVGAEQDAQAVPQTAQQRLQTRITYSCVNLPIETVLMELAEQAKIDIVKSPKVTGNVTVKVTDVPLEEALSNILAAHDYTYIATESMIRVVPLSELVVAKEQLVTRIYRITYADANDVATALRNFVSPQGRIAFNKGTSHIIVTDTESKIKGIDKFIKEIDLMTPQVLVEVRIYDITSQEGFELSPEWSVGRNAPYTADTFIFPDEVTVTETGRSDSWQERTTKIVGTERGDPDNYTETMTEHTWTDPAEETETTYAPPSAITTNYRRKPFVGGSFDRETGGTLRFSVLNDAVDIEFVLSILHKQVEAKLLANPRVLVLDNETADFEIIREIPYRELRQVAREDPITYTEFKNVGVHLQVTPHIARDGMIKLHIMPEFGVLVSQDPNGVPTIDTRRANTIALIKDGQTIAMGGLRKRETTKDVSKVPVLGDIPVVGGLFKSETESRVIRELVVFITTRIVTEPVLSATEKKQLEATEFAGPEMTKMRLERDSQLETEADRPEVTELTELLKMFLRKDEP